MILLKDFAEGRNVTSHTVATYIRRHPETFEGHTKVDGKKLFLDDAAVEILNKLYPAPLPDDIWTPQAKRAYDALAEELRETNKEVRLLNAEKRELQQYEMKYRALESEQKLLIEAAVDEKNKEITILEGFIADAKAEIQQLQDEKQELENKKRDDEKVLKEHYDQELEALREELKVEQSRKWKFPWSK